MKAELRWVCNWLYCCYHFFMQWFYFRIFYSRWEENC